MSNRTGKIVLIMLLIVTFSFMLLCIHLMFVITSDKNLMALDVITLSLMLAVVLALNIAWAVLLIRALKNS